MPLPSDVTFPSTNTYQKQVAVWVKFAPQNFSTLPVDFIDKYPFLEKITGDTFGIILYQEQVMMFMYDLAGLGWRTADTVRKVISKSQGVETFMKFKELFSEGCVKKGTLEKKEADDALQKLNKEKEEVEKLLLNFLVLLLEKKYL
jgi:DNA polymerase III alpha subunit